MDAMVEEAFRLNVKWSLQELSRAINGDGKTSVDPLFRVKVVLEGDKVSGNLSVSLADRRESAARLSEGYTFQIANVCLSTYFTVNFRGKLPFCRVAYRFSPKRLVLKENMTKGPFLENLDPKTHPYGLHIP